jgi:hypothetical protein
MTTEEFERLRAGDCFSRAGDDKVYFVNQVRSPGFYICCSADPKTLEPDRTSGFEPVRSGEGLTLIPRKDRRS